jgi:hypothetical protein
MYFGNEYSTLFCVCWETSPEDSTQGTRKLWLSCSLSGLSISFITHLVALSEVVDEPSEGKISSGIVLSSSDNSDNSASMHLEYASLEASSFMSRETTKC